ncbi:M4 family metallopeptidase [Dyadobacter arcticus]|uniref:Zn-dependent metalloprotease n=1 Tax=Dyadobacter arcticus TaxID=1078754 RepID=A0ABX0UI54_9BACT|nr:M4 family metallopeptidase [Dyadobacter arcticus]NIJ50886.1 Zn-dependent metalloprotease [Dyadobacter arcticus]
MIKNSTNSIRRIRFACLFIALTTQASFGQLMNERQKKMRINLETDLNVKSFQLSEQLKTPSFITFKSESPYKKEGAKELIKHYYTLTDGDELKLHANTDLPNGLTVERYKQFHKGIKVEHGAYIVTSRDSKIFSINAESFDIPADFSIKPTITSNQAKESALNFINAKTYAWQSLVEEKKKVKDRPAVVQNLDNLIAEYTPKGELVIAKALYKGGGAKLAYKFDIYASEPLSRTLIYVDAKSAEILLIDPVIKHANDNKTASANNDKVLVAPPIKAPKLIVPKTLKFHSPFRTASSAGTGLTRYAGTRNIFTTKVTVPIGGTPDPNNPLALLSFSGATPRVPIIPVVASQDVYILKDDTRGGGVETYDLNGIGGLPISVPGLQSTGLAFVDKDNNWKNENPFPATNEDLLRAPVPPAGAGVDEALNDDMAVDAHWGAEMVYDYWKVRHGRLSYDNNNAAIKSYVHYGVAYDNAFWNGSVMTYGDGSGTAAGGFKPLVSLDVCAHEIGHGVCTFTSDLVYQGESGAMNEGLSDIWAAAIENYVKGLSLSGLPGTYNPFQIGEQIAPDGVGLRRMDNPKAYSNPDTYGGDNWADPNCTPTLLNDQCGVHNNSGVLNKWFYFLVNGPNKTTGTAPNAFTDDGQNDLSENYGTLPGFNPLGFEKSEKITYLMEMMLTPNATFADARVASINAAVALYGACSQEEITVTDSWFAVNVGDAFGSCTAPLLSAKSTVTQVSEYANGACDRFNEYLVTTNLTAVQGTAVTVNFTGSGSLSTAEYQLIPSSVTYNAGEKGVKTILVRIYDDASVEGNETLTITAQSTFSSFESQLPITIIDDDTNPVFGTSVQLLNENFEGALEADMLPAGWDKIDKISPSEVSWKVLPAPAVSILQWTTKRAVIENPLLPGQATYSPIATAAQTILRTKQINALGLKQIKVSFTYSAGGEPACDPACDYAELVYSYDGQNFSTFAPDVLAPLFLQPTDQNVTVNLPASLNGKQFYLGFLWNNDENVGLLGSVTIDNVVVSASGRSIEGELNASVIEKVLPATGKPVYFYSTSDGQLIASIDNASADLGCVTATVTQAEGMGGINFKEGHRSQKVIQITPSSNPTATYRLSLYYKTAEVSTGYGVGPTALKVAKTNATNVNELSSENGTIKSPVVENHAPDGYYKYSVDFAGFSKFFLAEGVESGLPVTLVSFKVEENENTASLKWKTSAEENSSHFGIERSADAVRFTEIGVVKSIGNSAGDQQYSFVDKLPLAGQNYYRLKMTDADGTFAYSKIESADFNSDRQFQIYPNPVSDKLTIRFDEKRKVSMRLVNAAGQIVKKKALTGDSYNWDVSDLSEGVYLIEIVSDKGLKETRKVVIKK